MKNIYHSITNKKKVAVAIRQSRFQRKLLGIKELLYNSKRVNSLGHNDPKHLSA